MTDAMSTDPDLCLVAEEVRKVPPKRGRKPKQPREEYEKRVVAFVLGSVTEKKKQDEGCAYLSWVAVDADHQRQGIGTRLVRRLEELFKEEGMRTIVADTPETNVPARNFLEQLGFSNPISHVYMSLNMAKKDEGKTPRKQRNGGKSKGVKVRKVEVDDLSKIYSLGESVFTQERFPNLYSVWSEAEVMELFGSDGDTCFVAETSDASKTFLGFVLGSELERRKGSSWVSGYLTWLCVAPEAQGLGVGRRLVKQFEETMEEIGCRLLLCDTQADNLPAREFFIGMGFRALEEHVYYSKTNALDGDDEKNDEKATTGVKKGTIPQSRLTRLTKTKKIQSK